MPDVSPNLSVDVVEVKSDLRGLVQFGVLLLVFASLILIGSAYEDWDLAGIKSSLLFASPGLLCLSWKSGVTVDPRAGEVRFWRGFLIRMWGPVYPMTDFTEVILSEEARGSAASGNIERVFAVRMKRKSRRMRVRCFVIYSDAEDLSHRIADALGVPMAEDSIFSSRREDC